MLVTMVMAATNIDAMTESPNRFWLWQHRQALLKRRFRRGFDRR